MYTRTQTKTVYVGGVPVGGGHPVTVQSMTNTDTSDITATIDQIRALADAGCEIIRVAIPDMAAAWALLHIKKASPIPVVADVHFDYRLALAAIENGADGLRINPGNIAAGKPCIDSAESAGNIDDIAGADAGGNDRVRQIAEAANAAGIPIRVGVNGGSLEKEIYDKYGGITPEGLCESVIRHVKLLESYSFYNIALSVKASDIPLTLEAHRLLCKQSDYPLHIGITEAGTPYRGTIKSAAGIGALLAMGIGDTVRVSLTGNPVEEVRVAKEILQAFGLRRFGPQIISCPTCGRCQVDLVAITKKVEDFCNTLDKPITVAVMGCVVNGPGEAKEADFGIACGKGHGVIFKKGEIIEKAPEDQLADRLIKACSG